VEKIPVVVILHAWIRFLAKESGDGRKGNVLPDFFIGAHAAVSDFQLITRDRGRFSTCFPTVELIMPESNNGSTT